MHFLRFLMMEIVRITVPVALLAAGIASFVVISNQRKVPERIERITAIPTVETVAVELHDKALNFDVDGMVVPHREISLSGEVRGRITYKSPLCRAGRYVKEGEVLLQIDPRTYELDVERITEEVNQSNAAIRENDIEIQNTQALIEIAEKEASIQQLEFKKIVGLGERKAISETQVSEAERAYLAAKSSLTILKNQLSTYEARKPRLVSVRDLDQIRLDQAQLDFERSTIRAPIDGMVVSESVEVDSFVQPGTPMLAMEDIKAAEVRCNLRMEELAWLWQQDQSGSSPPQTNSPENDYQLPNTPVTVTYRLEDREYQWSGVLNRYEGIGLDEKTRTVPCRVLIEEPRYHRLPSDIESAVEVGPRALVRGMYVRVTVHVRPRSRLLRIPQQSIQPGNIVWSVRDGKLHRNELRNPHFLDEVALVVPEANGLQAGDQVVITPLAAAAEDMEVTTKQTSMTASIGELVHE
ncbi:MAG: HlyD family efflux transporter periplasmic adaptor subunit [Planctomycetota bacterium]|nr:HlyD family efflux transporter periplasmic adaptor subunit [Planctomycetota bacterium]